MIETESSISSEAIINEHFPSHSKLFIAAEAASYYNYYKQTKQGLIEAMETLTKERNARTMYPEAVERTKRVIRFDTELEVLQSRINRLRNDLNLHDKQSTPEIDRLQAQVETLKIAVNVEKGIKNIAAMQELGNGPSSATLLTDSWPFDLDFEQVSPEVLSSWLIADSPEDNSDDDDTGTQSVATPTE